MMKKTLFILVMLAALALFADPAFWPRTNVVEAFVNTANPSNTVVNNLDAALADFKPGEVLQVRLYEGIGDANVQARFAQNHGGEIPSVLFGGSYLVSGIQEANLYQNEAQSRIWTSSPFKLEVNQFQPVTGATSIQATLLDAQANQSGLSLMMYLIEDEVGNMDHVVRLLHSESISFAGAGQPLTVNHGFNVDPAWNQSNLWVMACVQNSGGAILQATSSLVMPSHSVRGVMDFAHMALIYPPNSSAETNTFWVFNMGQAQNIETILVVDNELSGWMFNYCDDEGHCFPGTIPQSFYLGTGEAKSLHMNLWVGAEGETAFSLKVSSPNMDPYLLPFHVQAGTSVSDNVLSPSVELGSNSPNPFRHTTEISLNLLKNERVALQVFDSKGRLVDETPVYELRAGENLVSWNAPANLSSGVYFYRIKGSPAAVKRMLLLK